MALSKTIGKIEKGYATRTKVDYSDPFVRALLSPAIIGRIKEVLAGENASPQLQGDLKL